MTMQELLHFLHKVKSISRTCYLSEDKNWIKFELTSSGGSSTSWIENEGILIKRSPYSFDLELLKYNGLYYDRDHFLSYCNPDKFKLAEIGIFDFSQEGFLIFNNETDKTFINEQISDDRFVENVKYYYEFCKALENFDSKQIYMNNATQYLVISSPENGIFKINMQLNFPEKLIGKNIKANYLLFKKSIIENKADEKSIIFINELIESLKTISIDERIIEFITHFESIQENTERSYELFLCKFSFSKLISEFKNEQVKFLSSIRDYQNQTLSKVIGVPLSISATAIAMVNAKKDVVFTFLILFGYLLYSIYTSFILMLTLADNYDAHQSFNENINTIIEKSPLSEKDIRDEVRNTNSKFNQLQNIIIILFLSLVVLSLIIVWFTFEYLSRSDNSLLLIMLLSIVFHFMSFPFKKFIDNQK